MRVLQCNSDVSSMKQDVVNNNCSIIPASDNLKKTPKHVVKWAKLYSSTEC